MEDQTELIREVERDRKASKTTTRLFADMCDIHPSRYCDIKFNRELATKEEIGNIKYTHSLLKLKAKVEDVKRGGLNGYTSRG